MCVAGQVQLQHSLSQMMIPQSIHTGCLWKASLADEVDLRTSGNENINELIKGWFSLLYMILYYNTLYYTIVLMYLFVQDQGKRTGKEEKYQ